MNAVEREVHRRRIREACADRGIVIRPRGLAFHLTGDGVDLLIDDLCGVRLEDLEAPKPRYRD